MIRSMTGFVLLSAVASLAAGGTFVVDPERSFVGVDVKASPPHHFTVELSDFDASIVFAEGEPRKARFAFQIADLNSDKESRDRKMRDWMEIDRFPRVVYELERVETDAQGRSHGIGTLTMHGSTRPVDVVFAADSGGDGLSLSGEAEINYHEWGLETIALLFFKVKPELRVRFELKGRLEP